MQPPQEIILNKRYKLLERIGSGGMAIVFKAHDLALGRVVAIKLLQESLTGDDEFLRRFQREAYAAANLSHPNIVTVHDIGTDRHRHYIVMEFVPGQTLKHLIRQRLRSTGRPLSTEHALDLAVQICDGIGYAHRAGLVHCDVKPQNVLVTPDGRVKVADFGIARALSQNHSSLLQGDQVWGTPQYFAPEQATGEPTTPASDVYAIGIILFEMLTGQTPFQAGDPIELALMHRDQPPPLASDINPAVPRQLVLIINKVLSKEPAGRYRTANQLGRILNSYRSDGVELVGPTPVSERKTQVFASQETPLARAPLPPVDPSADTGRRRPLPAGPPPQPAQRPSAAALKPARRQDTGTPQTIRVPAAVPEKRDWLAIGLAIIATTLLIGLIPLWLVVYLLWSGI
jgi:serine/threonine-protein kinase